MDKIYKLKLGEFIEDENTGYHITRVPGGWIFRKIYFGHSASSMTSVFVPFNNDFQNK